MRSKPLVKDILYLSDLKLRKGWKARHHNHEFPEFISVLRGKLHIKWGASVRVFKSPAVILHRPGVFHREWTGGDTCDIFSTGVRMNKGIPGFNDLYKEGDFTALCGRDALKAVKLMQEVRAELVGQKPGWEDSVRGHMALIIRLLSMVQVLSTKKKPSSEGGKKEIITKEAMLYIERNYGKKLSLGEISEAVYLSPFYLSHIFKEETGYSPLQYALKVKMENAKKLLRDRKLTVSEVSYKVGYESNHHFNRIFKMIEGITPGQYRNRQNR